MDLSTIVSLLGYRPDERAAAATLAGFKALVASSLDLSANGTDTRENFIRDVNAGFEARLAPSGEILDIFLKREGHEGFAAFPFSLAGSVVLGVSRGDVEAEFGAPDCSMPQRRNTSARRPWRDPKI